jgi:hypothetical protein
MPVRGNGVGDLSDPRVAVAGTSAEPVEVCPRCGRGTIVRRRGAFGLSLAYSAFPGCRYKRSLGWSSPTPMTHS